MKYGLVSACKRMWTIQDIATIKTNLSMKMPKWQQKHVNGQQITQFLSQKSGVSFTQRVLSAFMFA